MTENKKPKWWKPAIEGKGSLDLHTQLYLGYGGWLVTKNGETFYSAKIEDDFDGAKSLQDIENMIGEDPESEYIALFFGPLREATYQRHAKDQWVLIETGEGFA